MAEPDSGLVGPGPSRGDIGAGASGDHGARRQPSEFSSPIEENPAGADFGDVLWSFIAGAILAALVILLVSTHLKIERVDLYDVAIFPLPAGNEINLQLGLSDGHLLWRDAAGRTRQIVGW